MGYVVLDRVSDILVPDYCVHGKTRCVGCNQWVHLGTNTFTAVANREHLPVCKTCANTHRTPDAQAYDNLHDHKREDGLHD